MAIAGNPIMIAGGSGGVEQSVAHGVANALADSIASSYGTLALDTVSTLFEGVFSNNSTIGEASFPLVTEIPPYAFAGCTSMYAYEGPAQYVGNNAFEECVSLTTLTSTAFTEIDHHAFANCPVAPFDGVMSNVTSIGSYAFAVLSAETDYYDSIVSAMTGSSVEMPNVSYVGDHAFAKNSNFSNISFGPSLTYLGSYIIEGLATYTVTLSDSPVTNISYAFANCTTLTEAYLYLSSVPTGMSTAFENCGMLSAIHVTSGMYDSFVEVLSAFASAIVSDL